MLTKKLDVITIFIVGTFLFTFGLASQEIIGFESRFYLFALEMWRHGISWFPTTYQQPYPDYPVTSTLLIYWVSLLLGGINKLTAVLPSALASAATLSVTYLIGASHSRVWAWSSVFFLLFTLTFVNEARTISLDQYITLITALCFYYGVLRSSSLWMIGLFLILGFAFRGPIGIVIPTGVMCISFLLDKNIKRFFITGFLAVFLLILCSLILLGIAYHVGGMTFVQDVLRMEVLGRMHDVATLPMTFYFKESLGSYAVAYPLAIIILIGCLPFLFKMHTSFEVKILQKCIAWVLVILIGLSIPTDKKIRYILPMVPALALVCGYLFMSYHKNRYLTILHALFYAFCCVFPLIAVSVLWVLSKKSIETGVNYSALCVIFTMLQLIIIGVRKNPVAVLGVASLTFIVANVFIVEVINIKINATRDFVLQVEDLREKYHTPLVFFQEGTDGLPIKYLADMPNESSPVYLYHANELLKLKKHTLIIIGKENIPHISPEILQRMSEIMRGRVGHDEVVVLEIK